MEKYEFYTIIFSQNIYFNNHPQIRVLLWESGSIVEKFQCTVREKKSETRYTEEVKNIFTLLTSPHHQGGTAQCRERLPWPPISPMMESESAVSECVPSFPSYVGRCQRGPLISHPPIPLQSTEVIYITEGLLETLSPQSALENHLRDVDPTKPLADSFREATYKLLGILHLWALPPGPWTPTVVPALHLYTPTRSASCMHPCGQQVQGFVDVQWAWEGSWLDTVGLGKNYTNEHSGHWP